MNDYYGELGVARDATAEDIKRAYRRLARQLHPDVNPGPGSEERFKRVSQAYEVLSDPDKRRAFDMGADPFAPAGGGPGFGPGFSFADVMDAFFGGGGQAHRGPRSRQQRGQDALVPLDVELDQVIFGSEEELTIDTAVRCGSCGGSGSQEGTSTKTCTVCRGRGEVQQVQRSFLGQVMTSRPCHACRGFGTIITHPCLQCSGDGRARTRRTLRIKVPAGVDTGTRIQLAGEGEVGPGAGAPGDLYVEIRVRPHESYTRKGDDLHCTIQIPMTAAALGTTVSLDTFDGTSELEIRAGTQSGDTRTMRGQGVTHLRGTGRGDLVVHITVATPTRMTAEQEAALREFARLRGEEHPEGRVATTNRGFFDKVRDAFKA